ncbi:MAG: UDP-N-acetyl-D-mannosamine dehydrogenase [Candidatus Riflebacteria bacterium HGW-Riflebacteria-1]|jgi:UDP-N-acetyl-D-mannosaminuronic acid dehydrogenase|nr:MAG: UDP-N-acetyl-D-mannosamine dehydrogenase [Candidatus Riflebacteria bacterium HGW-Riflebacteria-1]
MKQICVLGLGYIGLPTSSILAAKGYQVLGVDVSKRVVDTINSGKIHITEPDLDLFVKAAVQSGKLRASLTPEPAEAFIIAVPTPFKDGKKPDMSYVEAATRSIVKYLRPGNLVILESTSPPQTCSQIILPLLKEAGFTPGRDIYLAHCPERVLPGQIMREVVENERVIGGYTPECAEKAKELYASFVKGAIHLTDSTTAEMVKLVENSFRDVNIAFANELSLICDSLKLNVWELIKLANLHPRVNILRPGPGVGGHCIAVDPWFIVDACPQDAKLIRTAREVNDSKPEFVVKKVRQAAERFKNPVIGILGLAYKPDIDDLRESPAIEIAHELKKNQTGTLMVCEPYCHEHPDFTLCDLDATLKQSDILVLLVAHQQFKKIDKELLKPKIVIDTCGIW